MSKTEAIVAADVIAEAEQYKAQANEHVKSEFFWKCCHHNVSIHKKKINEGYSNLKILSYPNL